MNKITLKILGSGSSMGTPMIGCSCKVCTSDHPRNKRLRCSSLITFNDKKILVDLTPDFRQQFLKNNIQDIDAIVLTHFHADHILGIDDLRALSMIHKKTYTVYGNKETLYEVNQRFSYLMKQRINNNPVMNFVELSDYEEFEVEGLKIRTFNIEHGNLTCLGLRMENLVYAVDVQHMPERSIEVIKDADLMVIAAMAPHRIGIHQNFEDAFAVSRKANIGKTYFTHISHHVDHQMELETGFELAYDGLEISNS